MSLGCREEHPQLGDAQPFGRPPRAPPRTERAASDHLADAGLDRLLGAAEAGAQRGVQGAAVRRAAVPGGEDDGVLLGVDADARVVAGAGRVVRGGAGTRRRRSCALRPGYRCSRAMIALLTTTSAPTCRRRVGPRRDRARQAG